MAMYDPPHPGEFIKEVYIRPFSLGARKMAESLQVSPSTLNRLLNVRHGHIESAQFLRVNLDLILFDHATDGSDL